MINWFKLIRINDAWNNPLLKNFPWHCGSEVQKLVHSNGLYFVIRITIVDQWRRRRVSRIVFDCKWKRENYLFIVRLSEQTTQCVISLIHVHIIRMKHVSTNMIDWWQTLIIWYHYLKNEKGQIDISNWWIQRIQLIIAKISTWTYDTDETSSLLQSSLE